MTMAPERERYRKLPGQRRGILRGASVWLGSDHLLLVKSVRFREEYKRFHLRDVQAIIVAKAPRFHLSTRAFGTACLWLAMFIAARGMASWVSTVLLGLAGGLVVNWLYFSYSCSCRCRIYTAVSCDDLPSVYRAWTARKFLAEVEPLITQAQGVIDADWAEAIENRDVGPPARARAVPYPPAPGPIVPGETPEAGPIPSPDPARPPARNRTTASGIFIAGLIADAGLTLLTLHSMTLTAQLLGYALAFVQVGGAIVIFIQRHRGILIAGMQKLAIATVVVMGASFYLRQVMAGVAATAARPVFLDPALLVSMPGYILLRQADAVIHLVLAVVGLALAVSPRHNFEAPPSITG